MDITIITRKEEYVGPVEVITSVERSRHWSATQKQAMVEEAEKPGEVVK